MKFVEIRRLFFSNEDYVQDQIPKILDTYIRPVFKNKPKKTTPITKKTIFDKDDEDSQDTFENQDWKSKQVDTTSALYWCALNVSQANLRESLHLFIPPLLTLLNDYDVFYREFGVRFLRVLVIEKCPPKEFRRTGLGPLIYQVCSFTGLQGS
jgi:hypothetical protein